MPAKIYSANNGPWLVSSTEQQYRSGLRSVSRQYLIPKGESHNFTINSLTHDGYSIYPDPTNSKSSDNAFDSVNLTGYKLQGGAIETQRLISISQIVKIYTWWKTDPIKGQYIFSKRFYYEPAFFEIIYTKKAQPISDNSIPGNVSNTVTDSAGNAITTATLFEVPSNQGGASSQPLQIQTKVTNVNRILYGQFQEIETTSEIISAFAEWHYYEPAN